MFYNVYFRKIFLIFIVCCEISLQGGVLTKPTFVQLGNSDFSVSLRLNSATSNILEKSRFDRTGRVQQIISSGKKWLVGDGLVDEFGISGKEGTLGYEDASSEKPEFLKFGIGILARDEAPYSFEKNYPIVKMFPVSLTQVSKEECIIQQKGSFRQWNYLYRKHYKVYPFQKKLQIVYEIQNLGPATLTLEQYNHNYFAAPQGKWDQNTCIRTNFQLQGWQKHWIIVHDREIRLRHSVSGKLYYSCDIFQPQEHFLPHQVELFWEGQLYWILIGDQPAKRFALFANNKALCPEIFVRLQILPGKTKQWRRIYLLADNLNREI